MHQIKMAVWKQLAYTLCFLAAAVVASGTITPTWRSLGPQADLLV